MSADEALPFSLVDGHDDGAVLDQAATWLEEGRLVALATVIRTWGSAPRPVGSHLVVESQGGFMGSVSGGCIEGAVITEACEAIREGSPRILDFGVSDAQAWDVGLACGGAIRIHVAPLDSEQVNRLQAFRHRGEPVALVTDLASGGQTLLTPESGEPPVSPSPVPLPPIPLPPIPLPEEQRRKIAAMLDQSTSGLLEFEPSRQLFVRSYASAWSLILVGAVHIAQFLAPMARLAGFDVTVIDPRRAFATAHRFPNLSVIVGWPDEIMAEMPLRRQSAIVTLAHDPKIDDPALFAALKSPAFYVGALGSRRTHAQRVQRLTAEGVSPTDIARIAAPVGLDLGGRSPAEIAVSVLAEIVGARYGRPRGAR